jgi:hypothetical protein
MRSFLAAATVVLLSLTAFAEETTPASKAAPGAAPNAAGPSAVTIPLSR